MEFIIEKPKTWKGLSYVLKSSVLKDEMDRHRLDCYVQLVYWTQRKSPEDLWNIIDANYWLPNENVDYSRFYIRTGVVPSSERKKAETLFKDVVLEKLIVWMMSLSTLDIKATKKNTYFSANYKDGEIFLSK